MEIDKIFGNASNFLLPQISSEHSPQQRSHKGYTCTNFKFSAFKTNQLLILFFFSQSSSESCWTMQRNLSTTCSCGPTAWCTWKTPSSSSNSSVIYAATTATGAALSTWTTCLRTSGRSFWSACSDWSMCSMSSATRTWSASADTWSSSNPSEMFHASSACSWPVPSSQSARSPAAWRSCPRWWAKSPRWEACVCFVFGVAPANESMLLLINFWHHSKSEISPEFVVWFINKWLLCAVLVEN